MYGDYHVSISYNDPCPFYDLGLETAFTWLFMKEYLTVGFGGTNDETYCPPAGCETKYPLYVSYCNGERMSDWVRAVDINNWFAEWSSYPHHATYIRSPLANCDTMVYAPAGIFPIRALEDTVSQDTVSQDTTSSSVLSVELLERAVRLYPNPANEVLNVACDYDIATVAVFDVLNRLVEERKVNAKTLQLSLANYAQGTYFITITTPKGKLNKKFVVQ
ncbi:MAG: T9SS type A sorting domain-containing protein [Candidatus Onthomorpha sp.]